MPPVTSQSFNATGGAKYILYWFFLVCGEAPLFNIEGPCVYLSASLLLTRVCWLLLPDFIQIVFIVIALNYFISYICAVSFFKGFSIFCQSFLKGCEQNLNPIPVVIPPCQDIHWSHFSRRWICSFLENLCRVLLENVLLRFYFSFFCAVKTKCNKSLASTSQFSIPSLH